MMLVKWLLNGIICFMKALLTSLTLPAQKIRPENNNFPRIQKLIVDGRTAPIDPVSWVLFSV